MNIKVSTKMEILWSREKYMVLSKSQQIYLQIRELLKDKKTDNYDNLVNLIDTAYRLPDNPSQMVNAYHHVFGYFKKKIGKEEKKQFMINIELFREGKLSDTVMKEFLYGIAVKLNESYLLASTYFEKKS